jgi:hypothetical protein
MMEFSSGRYRTKSARKKVNKNIQGRKRWMLYGLQREWNAIKLNARQRELLFVFTIPCALWSWSSAEKISKATPTNVSTGLD